jgi:hypothetical protein
MDSYHVKFGRPLPLFSLPHRLITPLQTGASTSLRGICPNHLKQCYTSFSSTGATLSLSRMSSFRTRSLAYFSLLMITFIVFFVNLVIYINACLRARIFPSPSTSSFIGITSFLVSFTSQTGDNGVWSNRRGGLEVAKSVITSRGVRDYGPAAWYISLK